MHAVPLTGTSELQPSVPRRVLVVDDRRDSVLLLRRMLELAGHEVHSAQILFFGAELTQVTASRRGSWAMAARNAEPVAEKREPARAT